MRIWKYMLAVADRQCIQIPAGAKLLDVQVQHGAPCLWVLCDEKQAAKPRHIAIYCTGNPMPDSPGDYIATFQLLGGDVVFHAFEVSA